MSELRFYVWNAIKHGYSKIGKEESRLVETAFLHVCYEDLSCIENFQGVVTVEFGAASSSRWHSDGCLIEKHYFLTWLHLVDFSHFIYLCIQFKVTGTVHINKHFCKCASSSCLGSFSTIVPGQVQNTKYIKTWTAIMYILQSTFIKIHDIP